MGLLVLKPRLAHALTRHACEGNGNPEASETGASGSGKSPKIQSAWAQVMSPISGDLHEKWTG